MWILDCMQHLRMLHRHILVAYACICILPGEDSRNSRCPNDVEQRLVGIVRQSITMASMSEQSITGGGSESSSNTVSKIITHTQEVFMSDENVKAFRDAGVAVYMWWLYAELQKRIEPSQDAGNLSP